MTDTADSIQRLALYDPRRTPKDYTALLLPGQFVVFLSDVRHDNEIGSDGAPLAPGDPPACYAVDSLEAAVSFADGVARKNPFAKGLIFDHRGRSATPVRTVVHPSQARRLPTRGRVRLMYAAALLTLTPIAPLLYWDYRYDFTAVVPTLIACNLFWICLRLLYWAHETHVELKRLEAAQSAAA